MLAHTSVEQQSGYIVLVTLQIYKVKRENYSVPYLVNAAKDTRFLT